MEDIKKAKKKPNAWMSHVQKVKKDNKDLSYPEVLQKAKDSYVKAQPKAQPKKPKEPKQPKEPKKPVV